ncbi:DegT/DnrJ/EryC1/StrS family aminotransferase [Micromonospora sp. MS34]|uniref:DegT/DnrJ/EryC1/StrS family aminotransferase n=1 Tax=Micromonospora sp. MS34 TaxID=3385971 RepID=UPI0039A16809
MTLPAPTGVPAALGGRPVRSEPWPAYDLGDVWLSRQDEEAALEAIRQRLYFRYDYRPFDKTYTGRFEKRLKSYFGTEYALACSSGTAAITLALLGMQLPRDAKVACPAFTFAATPSAIQLAGCAPVLVECQEDLRLDLENLRQVLSAGVDAIVVVHMRGLIDDMPSICALADDLGVPVIEDAVPALGAVLNGRPAGTWGRAGGFSTQSDKSLNTGEGGFLLTNDEELFARAVVYSGAYEGRLARHFPNGRPPINDLDHPIFSMRMDEIRAALAESLMDRLPDRLAAHRRNYDHVADRLADVDGIALRRPVAPGAYLGEALVFRVPGVDAERTAWIAGALRAEGIGARALADPADRNVRVFWNWRFLVGPDARAARARYPQTATYLDEAIDIPLSANLTQADCDQLITAVNKVIPVALSAV